MSKTNSMPMLIWKTKPQMIKGSSSSNLLGSSCPTTTTISAAIPINSPTTTQSSSSPSSCSDFQHVGSAPNFPLSPRKFQRSNSVEGNATRQRRISFLIGGDDED
eukprot:TCONS_00053873-protein